MIHNEVIAEGRGSSGRYAKVRASANALGILKGLAPFEFRERFGCDCRKKDAGLEGEEGVVDVVQAVEVQIGTAA
jgi:endoribonuclease Dicer